MEHDIIDGIDHWVCPDDAYAFAEDQEWANAGDDDPDEWANADMETEA